MNQTRTKTASCFRLLAGFALGGVLLLAPRAFAAESQAPVETKGKEKIIALAKSTYQKKADERKVTVDEAKATAFANCYYDCRYGKAPKGLDACNKQCGPEVYSSDPAAPAAPATK